MIKYDIHTHSLFSPDGSDPVEALCISAIKNGITHLAITDHFDADEDDTYPFYYNYETHSAAIEEARKKFMGRLTILKGIEYSQPYNTPEIFEKTVQLDFDIIIGSVHKIGSYDKYSEDNEEKYKRYFRNITKMINFGGFDILGHIDFPARYYNNYYTMSDELDEAIRALSESTIVPEINSSSLRRGFQFTLPDNLILERYADYGGRYIACGSDAHIASDIAAGFEYVEMLIKKYGFTPIYFKERKLCY
ncbi:MAG: histidinol-phosphatase HisJ family protein [Spirochaetes bacterium]|jgi:histidinol-phosphatase (PHP family)|nr:histidinol-phosphatase HisJ family protein [Spirochaetota bacterium]